MNFNSSLHLSMFSCYGTVKYVIDKGKSIFVDEYVAD